MSIRTNNKKAAFTKTKFAGMGALALAPTLGASVMTTAPVIANAVQSAVFMTAHADSTVSQLKYTLRFVDANDNNKVIYSDDITATVTGDGTTATITDSQGFFVGLAGGLTVHVSNVGGVSTIDSNDTNKIVQKIYDDVISHKMSYKLASNGEQASITTDANGNKVMDFAVIKADSSNSSAASSSAVTPSTSDSSNGTNPDQSGSDGSNIHYGSNSDNATSGGTGTTTNDSAASSNASSNASSGSSSAGSSSAGSSSAGSSSGTSSNGSSSGSSSAGSSSGTSSNGSSSGSSSAGSSSGDNSSATSNNSSKQSVSVNKNGETVASVNAGMNIADTNKNVNELIDIANQEKLSQTLIDNLKAAIEKANKDIDKDATNYTEADQMNIMKQFKLLADALAKKDVAYSVKDSLGNSDSSATSDSDSTSGDNNGSSSNNGGTSSTNGSGTTPTSTTKNIGTSDLAQTADNSSSKVSVAEILALSTIGLASVPLIGLRKKFM